MDDFTEAQRLLREWKGDSYRFGNHALDAIGGATKAFGETTLIVTNGSLWIRKALNAVEASLRESQVSYNLALGARPNAPLEDLYRIALQVAVHRSSSILALGSGSTIDACKAAGVLTTYTSKEVVRVLGVSWAEAGKIDPYFGTGIVTKMREATGKDLIPVVAIQTGASSAAHLTKYSNITDPMRGQKKLIVDDAIVPRAAFFDYEVTLTAPDELTIDGGLDGIAHCWEVFMGASGKDYYGKLEHLVPLSLRLIINYLPLAKKEPHNIKARTALGLGTDLGGYAIMIGGTNGPHLGSFSLVNVLTHGRACALLLPYYTVLFSPMIQDQLRTIAPIYRDVGLLEEDPAQLEGRELAETIARAMLRFDRTIGVPTTLKEAGVTEEHLRRMISAAKDPQLRMKLLNMPIPLDPEKGDVERYMGSVLEAAFTGNLSRVQVIRE
jgi:alcohol dehydrogenase class IV